MSYVEKYGLLVLFVLCSLIIGVGVFGDSSSAKETDRDGGAISQRDTSELGGRLMSGDANDRTARPAFELETVDPLRGAPLRRDPIGRSDLGDRGRRVSSGLTPVPSTDERGGNGLSPFRGSTFESIDDNRTMVFPGPGREPVAPNVDDDEPVAGFEVYTVAKNETLSEISQRKLGSTRHLQLIVAANPGMDPNRVLEGQKIKIPLAGSAMRDASKKAQQAKSNQAKSNQAKTDTSKPEPKPDPKAKPKPTAKAEPEPKPKTRVHVVKRGETLSELAKRYYQTATRAGFLAKANGMTLKDTLRAGRKLEIPPLPKKRD